METMKSALFATIFVIVGGVGIFLAFPAEDTREAFEFRQAKAELGLPPQIEDEKIADDAAVLPEPADKYSIVYPKPEVRIPTSRHRHIARHRPNFLEKLVVSFINLQKHHQGKTATERSHTTSGRG
jgi:hypothetical protein